MPRWRSGSRGEREGSGQQLYKAQRVCYTGACKDYDGKGEGHTLVGYSKKSQAAAIDELEKVLADHDKYVHGA